MWYVRFGDEEFGPFEEVELAHFLGQLGTTSAVEVRAGPAGNWRPIESTEALSHLRQDAQASYQDNMPSEDDRTLMSSEISPELMAEFGQLFDKHDHSSPLTSLDQPVLKVGREEPPETQVDDEHHIKTESSPPSENLSLIEMLSDAQSQQTEELSVGDKLAAFSTPHTDAMLVASPLRKTADTKSHEVGRLQTPSSGLIPSRVQPKPQAGVASPASKESYNVEVTRPSSTLVPRDGRNSSRTIVVALAITVLLGSVGIGVMLLLRPDVKSLESTAQVIEQSRAVNAKSQDNPADEAGLTFSATEVSEDDSTPIVKDKSIVSATPKKPINVGLKSKLRPKALKTKSGASKSKQSQIRKRKKKSTFSKAKVSKPKPRRSAITLVRLDRQQINRVMSAKASDFKLCEGAAGTQLTASLEILGSGRVRSVQLADFGKLSPKVKSCVIDVLQKIRFPRTKTPSVSIRIPFKL